jgi:uncharacterized membrane protein YhaH (DUF805 family)
MKQRYTIGSKADNDIHLPSQYVDARHAVIFLQDGQWYIEDLGSKFGTFIGQTKVNGPIPIPSNSLIKIGTEKLDWDDYLDPETEEPPVNASNILSFKGVIGRKTYQAIFVLALFTPAIVYFVLNSGLRVRGRGYQLPLEYVGPTWVAIMVVLGIVFLGITIRRWRDTGKPLWALLLPFYNLYVLLFIKSKQKNNTKAQTT